MHWYEILSLASGLVTAALTGIVAWVCRQNYQAGASRARLNGHDVEFKDIKEWLCRVEQKLDDLTRLIISRK